MRARVAAAFKNVAAPAGFVDALVTDIQTEIARRARRYDCTSFLLAPTGTVVVYVTVIRTSATKASVELQVAGKSTKFNIASAPDDGDTLPPGGDITHAPLPLPLEQPVPVPAAGVNKKRKKKKPAETSPPSGKRRRRTPTPTPTDDNELSD